MSTINIPEQLLVSLRSCKGFEEESFVSIHNNDHKLTSVRLNPFKLSDVFCDDKKVSWCTNAFYLPERPSFITDPLFHAGCYYVQEASSMFLEHALKSTVDFNKTLKVLDLCAAPGGKTTLVNSLITDDSLLVANEVIKTRVPVLAENLSKWGTRNTIVTNNDPKDFSRLTDFFDLMVIDAPCSGSGLFRKQADAVNEWSLNNVNICSARQQRILADAIPSLKQDGILIYSTCSYSPQENEEICDWLCSNYQLESIKIECPAEWGITETQSEQHKAYGYRFYPNKTEGEGFFIACFRKLNEDDGSKPKKNQLTKPTKAEFEILKNWIADIDTKLIIKNGENFHLLNNAHESDLATLSGTLYIKKSGITLGQIKGKDFVPDHQFALSNHISQHIQSIEVDLQHALAFLKKEEVKLTMQAPGFSLLTFQGYGLGWVKVLPNRVNNYLPKEWRILKNIEE